MDGLVNIYVRCLVRAGFGLVRTGRMVHGTEFGDEMTRGKAIDGWLGVMSLWTSQNGLLQAEVYC